MAVLNFPPKGPGDAGDTYEENGVIYTWTGSYWTANDVGGTLDDAYVEVAGDNMTGNLTLGGDKVTLDASDGSGTFAGTVKTTPAIATEIGFRADYTDNDNASYIGIRTNGKDYAFANYDASEAGLTFGITLDGSGMFAGDGDFGDQKYSAAGNGGVYVGGAGNIAGTIYSYKSTVDYQATDQASFARFFSAPNDSSAKTERIGFRSDGSGMFHGTIHAGSTSVTDTAVCLKTGVNEDIKLYGDGHATFAGRIEAGNNSTSYGVVAKNSAAGGNTFQAGLLAQNYTSGGSAIAVIPHDYVAGNQATAAIFEDGSATFAGIVDSIQFIANQNGGGVVASRNTDNLQVWRAGSTDFDIADVSTYTSEIMSDGSATFADTVGSVNGNNRSYLNPGNIAVQNTTLDSTTAFNIQGGRGSGSQADVVTFTTDGSASFAGDVNIGGLSSAPNIELNASGVVTLPGMYLSFNGGANAPTNGLIETPNTLPLKIRSGANDCLTISSDGNASFAGSVAVGGQNLASDTTNGVTAYPTGELYCQVEDTRAGTGDVINVFKGDDRTFQVSADGSIDADGNFFNGNKYANGTGTLISKDGYIQLRCDDSSDFIACLKDGNTVGDSVFTVDNDGSITAAGTLNVSDINSSDGGAILDAEGYLNLRPSSSISGDGSALSVFNGGYAIGNKTLSISKEGSIVCDGTVTANGTVLTRTSGGMTIDLGDRAEKVDAALTSLKTAAAAATDFAGLKAAIATALANI